ncbi:uncharacterized protein LOC143230324 isoform X2 [Tachypleus tridentatus]|uniref:uncharacterized protein LOC143230324 isoform X2 n=1 Tax=Tachypleus tridentatus TaxID=6853 RepID=UPI003FD3A206
MNGHVFLVKTLLLISGHSFAIVSAASCGCDPNLEKRIETAEIVTLTLNFKIDNIKARIEGLETRLETSEKRLSKQEEINRDKQQELSVLLEKISTLEETNRSCLNATEILKKQLEDVSKKLEYQSLDIMTIKDTSISLIKSVTELIKNDIVPGHQDAYDKESKPEDDEKTSTLQPDENKWDKQHCELVTSDKDLKVFHQGKPVMNGDRVKDGGDIMLFCLQGKTVNSQPIFKKVTCHNGQWNTEIPSCPFDSESKPEGLETEQNKLDKVDCELVISDKDLKVFHQGKPVMNGDRVKDGGDIMLFCLQRKTVNNQPIFKKVTCHNGQWNTEIPSCPFNSGLETEQNKLDKVDCELVTSDKDLKVFHQGKPVMNGDRVKDGGDIMLFCLQGKTVNNQPIFKKVTCHNGQWNMEIPSCPFDSESKPEGLETEQNKLDKVDCELVTSDKDLKVFHQGKPVMNGDRVKDGGDIMLFCLQGKTVNNQPIFKKVTCHNGQWNMEIPSCPFDSEFKPEGLETEQNKLDKVDCELEISDKDLKVFHQGKPVMNGDRVKDGGDIMLFCLQRKTVNNQPIFKKVTCHNGQWNMEIPSCPFDSESKPQGNEDDKDITKPEGLETGQNKFDKVDCELEISDKDLKVFHQGKPVMNGDRVKDGDDIMLFCLQGKTVNNQAIFKKVTCHNGQWNTEILSCPFNSDEEYEEQIIVEQNRNKQAREDCELVTSDKDLKIFHQGKPVGEGHQVKNGDDIMLFCLHEKTLNNEPVIKKVTCHNGQWNTEIPSCSFDSESQCTIHKLYDILPSGIIPRFIKDNYKRGEEVEVYCNNPGYFISGQKTVWCSPKGHWHQTDLKCEQGCKLLEPGPTSTIIILNRKPYYRFGEKMVLACPQGQYLENGVHSIVCLSPIWSDEFLPSCVDTED